MAEIKTLACLVPCVFSSCRTAFRNDRAGRAKSFLSLSPVPQTHTRSLVSNAPQLPELFSAIGCRGTPTRPKRETPQDPDSGLIQSLSQPFVD